MPVADRPNLYALLGVPPDASQSDLTRAYRRRARELHPDLAPAGCTDGESFTALVQAYQLLSDPVRRAAYDAAPHDPPARQRATTLATPSPIRRVRPPTGTRRPLIIAGPTHVYPNRPETTR